FAGRVYRQYHHVSRPSSRATTKSPAITSATTVPVLSLPPEFVAALDESVEGVPGTSSGPPFGAVWPGATGVVWVGSVVVVVVVVDVDLVCAAAVAGTSSSRATANRARLRMGRDRIGAGRGRKGAPTQ